MNAKAAKLIRTAMLLKLVITVAITALMIYALYVSKDHVTDIALFIGITGWQAYTAFVLVDLPALIGKLMQLPLWTAETRKHGKQMTYLSGSLSLVLNASSGMIHGSFGAAGWGIFVVLMFLYLESKLGKIKPGAQVTRAKNLKAAASAPATVAPAAGLTITKTIAMAGRKCPAGCGCKRHAANKVAATVAP